MEKNLLKQDFFYNRTSFYKKILFSTSLLAILVSTPEKILAEQKNFGNYYSSKQNIHPEKIDETKILKTFLKETLPEHFIKNIERIKKELDDQKKKFFLKGEIEELSDIPQSNNMHNSKQNNEEDLRTPDLKRKTQIKGNILKDPKLNLHIESQIEEDSTFQIDTQIGKEENKLTISFEKDF